MDQVNRHRGWLEGEEALDSRVLTTVLFTDVVGSTRLVAELGDQRWRELLVAYQGLVREQLVRFRGHEVDTAGDGFLITFDAPTRAIRCACAVTSSARDLGIEIRAGLHTGECELLDGKVRGIAVHTGARVAELAGPGEVLVSGTVRDVVAGSGVEFEDRGLSELRGILCRWRLFAVRQDDPNLGKPRATRVRRKAVGVSRSHKSTTPRTVLAGRGAGRGLDAPEVDAP